MTKSALLSVPRFLKRFMLEPVLEQRQVLVTVSFALAFLAVTQGLALLLIKGFLAAFFTDVSAVMVPLAGMLPDKFRVYMPPAWDVAVARDTLAIVVPVAIVITGIFKAFATYLYNLGLVKLSLKVAQNYREKVFGGVLALPWLSATRRDPGEWMSVIMADAIFIQSRLMDFSTAFVKDGVLILSCLVTLAVIHWPAALVLLAMAPIIGWQMGRAGRRIAWFTEAFQRELGVLAGRVLGIRERFRFMRAQHGEEFERRHFEKGNLAYLDMMGGSIFLRSLVAPGMEWVGFAVMAAFIYGWTRHLPGFDVRPDVVVQFFVALGLILRPVRELGEQIARWSETVGGLRRSMAVMAEVDAAISSGGAGQLSELAHQFKTTLLVDIKNAEVSYGERLAFKGQNLALGAGQAVAIIGPSGAGKSTIVKSLAGLVAPSHWDASMPWREITGHTTLVSQSPFLFKDTLRGNLLYGLPEDIRLVTTDEMLWGALRVVNLEEAVRGLPQGLESRFNPLETNLSGGQIQRLVIARAILRRPSILMLDEATSAVDVATEHDISTRLIGTVHETGTILLAVTHRLRWLELYDQVWFVENGAVIMTGTHSKLMNNERYRAFANTGSDT